MPMQFNVENGGKVLAVHVDGKLTKTDFDHADAAEARKWLADV